MKNLLDRFFAWLVGWALHSDYEPEQPTPITPVTTTPPMPTPSTQPQQPTPAADFSTPAKAYHSTRFICDEVGLSYTKTIEVELNGVSLGKFSQKDILCACVYQESGFLTHPKPNQNKDPKTGQVWSTDYGIVQVNDYYNIGPNKPFKTVQEVLDNPEKCIRWMSTIYTSTGRLGPWASYTTGAYKKWLKPGSPLWTLAAQK